MTVILPKSFWKNTYRPATGAAGFVCFKSKPQDTLFHEPAWGYAPYAEVTNLITDIVYEESKVLVIIQLLHLILM